MAAAPTSAQSLAVAIVETVARSTSEAPREVKFKGTTGAERLGQTVQPEVLGIAVQLPNDSGPIWLIRRRLFGSVDNEARVMVIILSALLITIYLTIFSAIFAYSEPEWNGVQAVYFVVATISTVGYGDIAGTQPWTKADADDLYR